MAEWCTCGGVRYGDKIVLVARQRTWERDHHQGSTFFKFILGKQKMRDCIKGRAAKATKDVYLLGAW